MAMMAAIAFSSLVHLCPRLRRVEGRGWGVSHGNNKEEKEGGWLSHIVVIVLPTMPPPTSGDVISQARIVANVLDNTFVSGEEEGAVMGVEELNGTTMTTTTLVCNAAAGEVVDDVPAGQGYDGQQYGSYHWRGGTAVGGSFTDDGTIKNKCNNQPNKRLDNF
jgi:hypothetical protein